MLLPPGLAPSLLSQFVCGEGGGQDGGVASASETVEALGFKTGLFFDDLRDFETSGPIGVEAVSYLNSRPDVHGRQRTRVGCYGHLMVAGKSPSLRLERKMWDAGDEVVIGIDEVGRGSWAGVVTVGAVVAPNEHLKGVRDSKLLSEADRVALVPSIKTWALAYGVGHASHTECDLLGMTSALRLAAERALEAVAVQGYKPDRVILDGKHNYLGPGLKVTTVIKGDQTVLSCAAASVLAKVERDGMMVEEAEHFPHYSFDSNRGYPAPVHRTALEGYGPCAIHRRSWAFMDGLLWPQLKYERQPSLFG